MFRSNLKIIIRQLRSVYSFINLLGLTVGFTAFTLIFLWVNDEISYDKFHRDHKNIYRVISDQPADKNEINRTATTCAPLAEYLKTNFGEVEESCKVRLAEYFLKYKDGGFYKKGILADPSFFKIFNFPLTKGALSSFDEGTDKIIISERLAETYFGEEDAMGKVFLIGGRDIVVVGVMGNIPTNSHLQFEYVIPLKFGEAMGLFTLDSWDSYFVFTYVKTTKINLHQIAQKIREVVIKNSPKATTTLSLQSLADIHLKSNNINGDMEDHGNIMFVYLFSSIAIFVLIIASINYSNLATARSIKRSKETGVRKVMGSSRFQLAVFFFSEALFYCIAALGLSMLVVWLILPSFNDLTGKHLGFDILSLSVILPLLSVTFICAFAGGVYPALVLSAQRPVVVFKGLAKAGGKAIFIRRALVALQFIVTISLLTGSLIIQRQLDYITAKNLGYDKENMLSFTMVRKVRANYVTIKNELLTLPAVKSVSVNNQNISSNNYWTDEFVWAGKDPNKNLLIYQLVTDHDFLKTYNVPLLAGRDFSNQIASDSTALLINEEAVTLMNMEDPINKIVKLHDKEYTIIGVVKNFHFTSIHKKIEPLILYIDPALFFQISIKLNKGNLPEQIKAIEAVFKKITPDRPFDYTFLDQDIHKLYVTENRTGKVFKYFTALAIFISCLGLLGIVLFVTEQRAKELAVRKVLGASIFKLMMIVSLEYVILAFVGFCIAAPLMYYAMGRWLANFAYHSELSIWVFLLAGLLTLFVAWLTVAYRSFQAATDNPVKSLRSE